jgi:hypothetical protein
MSGDGLLFEHPSCVSHVSWQKLQCDCDTRNNVYNKINGKELLKMHYGKKMVGN